MKRAQMEMVGLVVIVILITLGMLIFAALSISQGPKEKKIFTRKELAYSTLSALMKTTIEEGVCGFDFRPELEADILEDCAAHVDNPSFSTFQCEYNGQKLNSCEFFREIASDLFEETLGNWNKRYEFQSRFIPYGVEAETEIRDLMEEPIKSSRGGCPATRERDTSTIFPLSVEATGGQVQSVLYICD